MRVYWLTLSARTLGTVVDDPHWEWRYGMRYYVPIYPIDGGIVTHATAGRYTEDGGPIPPGSLPDFGDAATRGAVLQLVRDLWRCPRAAVGPMTSPGSESLWEIRGLAFDEKAAKKLGVIPGSVNFDGFEKEELALYNGVKRAP